VLFLLNTNLIVEVVKRAEEAVIVKREVQVLQ
jgi:hypothetical protein